MSRAKTSVALAALVITSSCVCGYWVVEARPMLDESTYVRRAYVPPWQNDTYEKRFYSIDLPAFSRWVSRGAFAVTGWRWPEFDDAHYEFNPQYPLYPKNIPLFDGDVAPRGPVYVLRTVVAIFLTGAVAVMFYLGTKAAGTPIAGVLAGVAFLVHPAAGQWLIGYPGTDATILFWMVLFAALWVRFHGDTACAASKVLVMALVAGLAAGTKINGGLLVVAYAPYLVIRCRGARRVWAPLLFCAAAFLVFVAMNPVLWQPGAGGIIPGIRDILARRMEVMRRQTVMARIQLPFAYFETRWFLLPLAPWIIFLFYLARRQPWIVPVLWWGSVIFIGSYVVLNRYDPRLGFPLDAALIVPTTMAALFAASESWKILRARWTAATDKEGETG